MGAGTSAPLFVELQKPLDASDLENFEDARNEVVHLRRLLAKAAVRLFYSFSCDCLLMTRQDNQQDNHKIRQDKDKARKETTRHKAREDNNSLTKMSFI
jgi:hypothetical protein